MTDQQPSVHKMLREDILASGHDDWVSLAEVQGMVIRRVAGTTTPERQHLILETIKSLLREGLVEVGDIPAPGDPGFLVWPGSPEEIMARLSERVVGRYDDPDSWEYSTWLNLTPSGDQASAEVVRIRSAARNS